MKKLLGILVLSLLFSGNIYAETKKKEKVKKKIKAKYHKIKDWVMDPKGYFLIAIDRKKKI